MKLWRTKDKEACAACAALGGTLVEDLRFPPNPTCGQEGGCRCVTVLARKLAEGTLTQRFVLRLRRTDALRILFGRKLALTTQTPVACYEGAEGFVCGEASYTAEVTRA